MRKKIFSIYILLLFFISGVFAQLAPPKPDDGSLVKWMSFKEAFEKNSKVPKPFLIDIYTDWCGWCKHMMKTTYAVPELANYINTNFYAVKFDAETHDTIEYLGEKFINESSAKKSTHQLTYKLLGKSISYPSTIFMNNNFQYSLLSAGYMEVNKIEPLLVYTLENVFRTTQYENFKENYELAFVDTTKKILSNNLKIYSMSQALELSKKEPRKILIDIYTNWCNSCRIMNRTTFRDTAVTAYLNKNFYFVDFNAENTDVINFDGKKFQQNPSESPFHPFALYVLKGHLVLPSQVIINEDLKVTDSVPFYLTSSTLYPILKFYGENVYKTMPWADYYKKYMEANKTSK
jgi:thioredoxin-related protein